MEAQLRQTAVKYDRDVQQVYVTGVLMGLINRENNRTEELR